VVIAKPVFVSMLLVGAALAGSARAVAEPAPPPAPAPAKDSKAADAAGRQHFQRGQKATNAGDYAGAYREFEAGYAVTGRPLFLFNMAESARAMGDPAKARDAYRAFLRADPDSALAATAKTRLSEIEPPAAPVAPPPVVPAPAPLLPPSATVPTASAGQPLPAAPVAAHDDAPVWKKWPFWAVVGTAVVAGGVTVYLVERNSSSEPCGTGCTTIDFTK